MVITTPDIGGKNGANMPGSNCILPGGRVFHVLNRGVGRQRLFDNAADYEASESIIDESTPIEKSSRFFQESPVAYPE